MDLGYDGGMGNQQDRDKLILTSMTSLKQTMTDNSGWETINMTPSLLTKKDVIKTPGGFNLTPFPKRHSLGSTTYSNRLNHRSPVQSKDKPRRYSQNRKVDAPKPIEKKSRLALTTRTLQTLHQIEEGHEDKLNSTICNGGVSITKQAIYGLSPVKEKEPKKAKKVTVVPLKVFILKNLDSSLECSQTKVENWLSDTEKHVLSKNFTDLADMPLGTPTEGCLSQNFGNSIFVGSQDEIEQSKNVKMNENVRPKKNIRLKKIMKENLSAEKFSPIPPECSNFETENTLESCIMSEICKTSYDEGVKTKPTKKRKKRKRIVMPTSAVKKTKQKNIHKKINNRVKGKELSVPVVTNEKLNVKLQNGSLDFVNKADCGYHLRSRSAAVNRPASRQIENVHVASHLNVEKNITEEDDCRSGVVCVAEENTTPATKVQVQEEIIKPTPDVVDLVLNGETPPSNITGSRLSTGLGKRKLSFYDRAEFKSCKNIIFNGSENNSVASNDTRDEKESLLPNETCCLHTPESEVKNNLICFQRVRQISDDMQSISGISDCLDYLSIE